MTRGRSCLDGSDVVNIQNLVEAIVFGLDWA